MWTYGLENMPCMEINVIVGSAIKCDCGISRCYIWQALNDLISFNTFTINQANDFLWLSENEQFSLHTQENPHLLLDSGMWWSVVQYTVIKTKVISENHHDIWLKSEGHYLSGNKLLSSGNLLKTLLVGHPQRVFYNCYSPLPVLKDYSTKQAHLPSSIWPLCWKYFT